MLSTLLHHYRTRHQPIRSFRRQSRPLYVIFFYLMVKGSLIVMILQDFGAFSFDQSVPTAAMLPCSPLEAAPEASHYSLFDTPSIHPQAPQPRHRFENLSINTSFI